MTTFTQKRLLQVQTHGWAVIAFGFFGFFAWSATFLIDQGIAATGHLVSKTEKIPVISPATGLVTKVAKRAGDSVKAGDILLEFDTKPIDSTQRATTESISGIQTANISLKTALKSRQDQIAALQSQHDSYKKLVDSGFSSANSLTPTQTQLSLAQSEALELTSRIDQNESRLRELRERIASLEHEKTLRKIISPVDGKVMNSTVKSAGVNIAAGTQILEIAPDSDDLLIDARVPVEHATLVATGMSVDVMFPSLPGASTTRVSGTIDYLSADRIVDQRTNQIFLEGKIRLLPDPNLESFKLKAGLPATVMINTGPRTLLSYITRPVTERVALGMR